MLKTRMIFTVLLVNLYVETSGAEILDAIDFRMLVGGCLLSRTKLLATFLVLGFNVLQRRLATIYGTLATQSRSDLMFTR